MPLPEPKKDETEDDFMDRCLSNENVNKEFPDKNERYGFCITRWERAKESKNSQEEENEKNQEYS